MCRAKSYAPGFMLIDVMAALVLLGVGIAATMQFMASSTSANAETGRLAVAMVLANNVHEYAVGLDPGLLPATLPNPPQYLLQLDGTYSPPIDGEGQTITNMPAWSQRVSVVSINRWDLAALPATPVTATATNLRRLSVMVFHNGKVVCGSTWVIAPSVPQQ